MIKTQKRAYYFKVISEEFNHWAHNIQPLIDVVTLINKLKGNSDKYNFS